MPLCYTNPSVYSHNPFKMEFSERIRAAKRRQADVEADLEQKAAENELVASPNSKPRLPVADVYAQPLATGNQERDEAFQVIAHLLAPDSRLVSKAGAIEV